MVLRTCVWFRLFYEADRRPRLAALPENRPRRNHGAPVCCDAPILAARRDGRAGRAPFELHSGVVHRRIMRTWGGTSLSAVTKRDVRRGSGPPLQPPAGR